MSSRAGGRLTAISGRRPQILRPAASAACSRVVLSNHPQQWETYAWPTHSNEISTLNTLIATTIDSITGYEDSAKNIDNERFREIFRQRADERQQVVEELRGEVRRLGGNPEDGGSFLGKAHQRFEDLKAAITGRDEKAIINEVERGEDYLKEKFEAALQSGEPERRNPRSSSAATSRSAQATTRSASSSTAWKAHAYS